MKDQIHVQIKAPPDNFEQVWVAGHHNPMWVKDFNLPDPDF